MTCIVVDGGALTMALNVLRRAGKNEVADALEVTAIRLVDQKIVPKIPTAEMCEAFRYVADAKLTNYSISVAYETMLAVSPATTVTTPT